VSTTAIKLRRLYLMSGTLASLDRRETREKPPGSMTLRADRQCRLNATRHDRHGRGERIGADTPSPSSLIPVANIPAYGSEHSSIRTVANLVIDPHAVAAPAGFAYHAWIRCHLC